ncbi:hypothetical protein A2303_02630 [Candidatus Falkowbacteria bacterium RIFOXYB2_FULL_47_14]|uniref:DUF5667 domain-containing protein n=1 Tax=Candidatus Falkowbacteria bacterium RIFOXYA2_FULL_47_19 TaxID=1797994 RepID=A0A1F5SHG7_9BACT|nr:MAG: hypothetical protein A2227_05805 [Candidatus Falkowbacteria bacterium RIFOXYA2_FULL_47_19]OGF34527.1 MAG: hypothetical protein A2468_04845 [Candidatus Falkowbacteria bacterium RIFOXYC2_FULL_46_15]OGF43018.1 MAG: hypothetical protein A2303_02630 [Candidatus Falkowbacteria bacterium RIFOXYB2_FULL_47_14]
MKEDDILIQLNKLKDIEPDAEWKKRNRELLYSQVSAQADEGARIGWFKVFERQLSIFTLRVSQPAMTVMLIIVFIFGGGILSLRAARDTAPGDSMYIAKILGEKTQYALTFDVKKKAQLGLEFAGNRVKEINKVLTQNESGDKTETVARLKEDFKKELSGVKDRVAKINEEQKISVKDAPAADENKEEVSGQEELSTENTEEGEDVQLFSAAFERDDRGVQVSESEPIPFPAAAGEGDNEPATGTNLLEAEGPATTSEAAANSTSSAEVVEKSAVPNPEEALYQAGELLSQEDYSATLNKLDEAGEAIDQVNKEEGEVLGAEEVVENNTASTTAN